MVKPVPKSIVLSPAQRETLDLIIQGPAQPEHVILLWSDELSESATAEKLGISEKEVRTLRYRW
jgi:DNA-binding CsgD family transcriptional regulator